MLSDPSYRLVSECGSFVDGDGGTGRQLTNFTSLKIYSYQWSADGTKLALVSGDSPSDVVLIKDARRKEKWLAVSFMVPGSRAKLKNVNSCRGLWADSRSKTSPATNQTVIMKSQWWAVLL